MRVPPDESLSSCLDDNEHLVLFFSRSIVASVRPCACHAAIAVAVGTSHNAYLLKMLSVSICLTTP